MRFVEIPAADGFVLHGTLYGEEHAHAIVVASAMSVPRRYYDAFAQYAAQQGFAVLVFDYRGFGVSQKSDAHLHEWGTLDIPAAIDFMKAKSMTLVGQSVGGQVAGLAHNLGNAQKIVFVASQSGYWRHWPGWRRYGVLLLWLTMPATARLLGFFPARLVGLGSEDLPRNVAIEWARFGRNPRYVLGFGDELDLSGYAAYSGPLLAWSFEGDSYAPPNGVAALLREYSSARIERRHVKDPRVGHFGFFRRGSETLWQETLDWIKRDPDTPLSAVAGSSHPAQATASARPR